MLSVGSDELAAISRDEVAAKLTVFFVQNIAHSTCLEDGFRDRIAQKKNIEISRFS